MSIVKTFNIEDIKYVERSCDISKKKFDQEEKIEKYLLRLVHKLETHYKDETLKMNIIFYNFFINEVKSVFTLQVCIIITGMHNKTDRGYTLFDTCQRA